MSDWRSRAKPADDWRSRAQPSGAEGGGPDYSGNPSVDLVPPEETPVDARDVQRRESEAEYKRQAIANSMSGGQYLADLGKRDPEAARRFSDRQNVGAVADVLSVARGASGPLGPFLDEAAGFVKSGRVSGPAYERAQGEALQTVDAATQKTPIGPVIGAMMLPQPATVAGRIGLNTAGGAAEGFGGAKSLDAAPTEAMKKAAVAAVLSALGEGIAGGAKAGGQNLTDRTSAARQALKASGLRGGINSQLEKMGHDDVSALQLGRDALDEGLIPFGGSKAAIRDLSDRMKEQAGTSYGAQLAQGDVKGALDYDELTNAMLEPYNSANAVKRSAGGQALDLVDQFEQQGRTTPGSFVGAGDAKASAWDSANFSNAVGVKNAPRLYRETMGAGAKNITEQLARVDPEAAEALRVAGQKYGTAADINRLATEAAKRELENNSLGMTELLMGVGGAAAGAPSGNMLASGATGAGAAFLGGLAKRRGNAAAAVALDKLQGLGEPLGMLGAGVQRAEAAIPEETRSEGLLGKYLRLIGQTK